MLGILASIVAIIQFIAQPPRGLVRLLNLDPTVERPRERASSPRPGLKKGGDAGRPSPAPTAPVKWRKVPEVMLEGSLLIFFLSTWFGVVVGVGEATGFELLGFFAGFIYLFALIVVVKKATDVLPGAEDPDVFSRLYLFLLLILNTTLSAWAGGLHGWHGSNAFADVAPALQMLITGLAFIGTSFESRSWSFGAAWGALLTLSIFLPGLLLLDSTYETSRASGSLVFAAPVMIVGGLLGWLGAVTARSA